MFSGSLVAIATPMRPDGAVDLGAWERLLDFHAASGTSGIVVGGTTGESATLSDSELWELTERACTHVRKRMQVIVGDWHQQYRHHRRACAENVGAAG